MGNKLIWAIYEKEKTEQAALDFESAIKSSKAERVLPYFQDAKLLRSLVVRRGENNKYFDLIEEAFNLLLGVESIDTTLGKDGLIAFLHKNNISEQILVELENIAYHRREKGKFFQLMNAIKKLENQLENKNILARSAHDLATWLSAEGEFEKAIEENKRALELARKYGEPVIELKAKFGLTHDKHDLKPKLQIEDYIKYSEELEKHDLHYDAIQAKINAAQMMYRAALKLEKNQQRDKLEEAKNIALEALKSAKDIQYPNAEVRAREVLSQTYAQLDESRKVKSYKKGADKIRHDFTYKSTPLTK